MGVVEKKKTVFDNNATIKANAERANNTIKTLNNTVDELETTITEKNAEIKMYQYDITDKSVKLNNTKIAMNELGVEDATADNTAEKVPDVYNKGVESQQETINSLNEAIEYQDSIIQEKETAIQQKDKENAEQFEMLKDTYTAISNYGIDDVTPYNTAEKVPEVYDKGKTDEYNAFWDIFQDKGNRTNYVCGFSGVGWTKETFKPKYTPIKVGIDNGYYRTRSMFQYFGTRNYGYLETIGVDLTPDIVDFSTATNMTNTFNCASFRSVTADISNATSIGQMFGANDGGRVLYITLTTSEKTADFNSTVFGYQSFLIELIFTEGSVVKGALDLQRSTKLTHNSLLNIINALYDYSTEGTTHTCNLGNTNLAKLTDSEKAIATQKGWTLA